jgi:hypothetical protein
VAARLRDRPNVTVTKTRGDMLELRVLVDGQEIADWSGRAWPMPSTVLAKIEQALARG